MSKERMRLRAVGSLLKTTYTRWSAHSAPRLGAALAYYALLSISPLMLLTVALCGIMLNQTVAEARVLDQTRMLMGGQAARTLQGLIGDAQHRGSGIAATVVALITLIFGASGVFMELRYALNTIWDAPVQAGGGWRSMLKDKLVSFAMVLGCGLFLLTSVLVSAAFAVAERFATNLIPLSAAIAGEILNLVVSLILLTVLFGLLYKVVPNVAIHWQDVGVGAAATAVLFVIGKGLLSIYLTKAAVGSTYGAAGSLVAFIVWIYYSAQIFFFGAVFTRVYAESRMAAPRARAVEAGR
jgi:membrane protein